MISYEEFEKGIELRSSQAISTPCYICDTPHTMGFLCTPCWNEYVVDSGIEITRVGVYKKIKEILTEQIAAQIEKELLA